MLYAGLDLSRKRLDFHLLDDEGATVDVGAAPPDADGLLGLARRLERHRESIRAAIESMNGARFVHDRLELAGWQVEIADAQKVKGLAPLACKTDRIDAWVLAELARRDLVPAIWLPDPRVRAERERARWRLHLVRHRSSLKQRVHAVLLTHGKPCPVSDLFGVRGRRLLARLDLPRSVARNDRGQPAADRRARPRNRRVRTRTAAARRRPPLRAAALHGAGDQLGARVHDRSRARRHQPLPHPAQARRLHRPLPPRLPIRRTRPARPALKARTPLPALGARRGSHPRLHPPTYRDRYQQTKTRIGKQRGAKVAQIDLARRLAEAIWHMLDRAEPFAPKGATDPLAA
jgi:transposase